MTFKDNFLHADMHMGNIVVCKDGGLSILDAGLVAELNAEDRKNFVQLFHAVIKNDGRAVGRLMIERSRGARCDSAKAAAFENELVGIVDDVHRSGLSLGRISLVEILQRVLTACYNNSVKLESRFVTVIIGMGVAEGVGRNLDPDVDILKHAAPFILAAELTPKQR